jgi:hypothetical protein
MKKYVNVRVQAPLDGDFSLHIRAGRSTGAGGVKKPNG